MWSFANFRVKTPTPMSNGTSEILIGQDDAAKAGRLVSDCEITSGPGVGDYQTFTWAPKFSSLRSPEPRRNQS